MLSGTAEIRRFTPRELKIKMAEHDMTAKEFAEMVGVTPSYLSNLMTGRQEHASRVVRIRIAEVVDLLDAQLKLEEMEAKKSGGPRVRHL